MTTGLAAPDALVRAVGRFHTAPADVASYDTDTATAARALRAGEEQIGLLAEAGLPHLLDDRGAPRFDYDDLMNVGMFCGTGETVPELGLRFLMRFASTARPTWFGPRAWEVGVHPARTAAGAPDDGSGALPTVRVRLPDDRGPGVELLDGAELPDGELAEGGYQVAVRLTGEDHRIGDPAIRAVWDEVVGTLAARDVLYQTVPEALRSDHRRAWELGMADCVVASRLLADRLTSLGYRARARRGYLLGLFGSDHAWCEVYEDGAYRSLDPVFAFVSLLGDRTRGVARSPEFAEACFGGRFNRLLPCRTETAAPLVYFADAPAPYWAMAGVGARPRRTS
ncbi:transglutaminase domain-containing protein [Kitasatospora sp. NPDC056184]|uniref:transglutaminase domain-containing protein n=1 Tax=Kitasatospora sp. NPDC056184 TaxID=3345738 RepID=UPI0035D991F0